MTLDEACAVKLTHRNGGVVEARKLQIAQQTINRHAAIRRGHKGVFPVQDIHAAYRERLNALLAYKLALACGLLAPWSAA